MRIIISGGGTGGHIFPAIAIADEFRRRFSDVEILFVGAKGKMEEERVPKAGYDIECLEISGFDRGAILKNVGLPIKMCKSLHSVRKIIKRFAPDVVIGVGGFASAPTLFMASIMGIPTFVQEQNAYPGVTNKIVSKKAKSVFTAYDGMDKFFGKGKTVITGNPVRKDVVEIEGKREEAVRFFGLDENKRTLLIVGGSLGARSINDCIGRELKRLLGANIQLIWQTGKGYDVDKTIVAGKDVRVLPFIDRMDLAYAAADVIVSRAGAIAISELCCVGKPVIFVPFPYASEDHQTKNAMSLVNKDAAICIKNENIDKDLVDTILRLFADESNIAKLSANIKKLELKDAAKSIVDAIMSTMNQDILQKENSKRVFFIGIGGIGMSALARYYKANGYEVSGYDSTQSAITDALKNEGIDVTFNNDIDNIDKEATLVVYTPAVKSHVGYDYYASMNIPVIKRAEALANIVDKYRTIAVAGTHGKTTTSTMIAHLMQKSSVGCNSFLGGISANYNTNLLLSDDAEFAVTEADEFDRSFLKLNPSIAVITSADADHLDIYNNKESLVKAFEEYAYKAKELLILKHGLELDLSKVGSVNILTYSITDHKADCYADNIRHSGKETIYDIVYNGDIVRDVHLSMPGIINVENSLAAFLVAKSIGLSNNQIKEAFATFVGVRRRFDFIIERDDFVYVDDYCHHPSEIKAFVESIRAIYPNKRLTGVFQPHLYSRTKDFADDFANSLSMLDEVILLDIYPAREKPIEGVNSKMILDKITSTNKYLVSKEELIGKIKELNPEVLMTMGAGDIDRFVKPISIEMI